MGGFRTPAHTQTIDRRWPASENLHQLSRSADDRSASEADVEARIEIYHDAPAPSSF
jgi:hypothetical protein